MIFHVQLLASFALFGLIWTIQLVHYPSFYFIEEKRFIEFERFHSQSITYIVAPLMIIEIVTGAYLVFQDRFNPFFILNLIVIGLIWLITIFISVPCHNELLKGKNLQVISRLVKTNWLRTFFWSFKVLILCFYYFN